MKRLILLETLLLLLCSVLMADIAQYYAFSSGTGAYTEITGTVVPTATGDDAISSVVDIGFTFPYGLNTYTQMKISTNGFIFLGDNGNDSNGNTLNSATNCPVLAPLWDDNEIPATGSAQYLLSGTAPNRILTIQYSAVEWNYQATNSYNFQVKMYETGKVEFVYGTFTGAPNAATASIGINMLPGGASNFFSVTPGATATASSTVENNSISAWPGNGTIYTFNPPVPVPNDLAAMSITGNLTPTQGTAANYAVSVRNFGTAAQSNYSVKIMTGTTELASIAGPAIQPGIVTSVTVPWTPQTAGPVTIYGKVVLAGDQNANNDSSSPVNVTVQAAGTNAITIGDGSQTARFPVDMYWKNSLFETIYQANEISMGGVITGVSFYNNFFDDRQNMPTKIWLGTTPLTDLSAGWIPSTQLTQVFDGNVNYPIGTNTITIPFTTPFAYGGTNLIMMVNRPMDTQYYSSADYFLCQTVGANRSLNIQSDGTLYDPAAPPAAGATNSGQFPKTTFYITPAGPNPVFGVAPESKNFGTVLMNQVAPQIFSVFNMGGGALTISNISLTGSPMFNLQNLPTLPITLNSGQNTTFTARYSPTAAGTHTGTISITDNLARVTHTVALSGTCIDPTIYVSPYSQAFDTVTTPNLPIDWQKLITTGPASTCVTSITTPHSAPNSVYMYNNSDAAPNLMLISPPIANTLPINTMRTKFWAKGAAGYTLSVGILSNPQDATTYTEVQSITLTNAWAEYTVGFQTYAGTGHYIAYKHGLGGTYRGIYIDDAMIEVIPQNDLAALTLMGNTTPTQGTAANYTVSVFNWGTVAQSNYLVKLYNAAGTELASTNGVAVSPGTTQNVILSWTPQASGALSIYGKVLLTGDQNPLNDQTANMVLAIQSPGTIVVTVGAGDQTARMPVDMYFQNSLFETVFQAGEIAMGGVITGISFYTNFLTNLSNKPTKIWLGMTNENDLSAGWIPSTALTQVFDGTVNYPTGINTITIPFSTPFAYGGSNLVMMVNRPMDTAFFSSQDMFYCQTVGTNRSRNVYSDGTNYDPTNPPVATTLTGQFPKTSFFFTAATGPAAFGISPTSKNFGTMLMNTTSNQNFTLYNAGGGTITINSISLSGSPMYTLQNLPTLPVSLSSGQIATFTAMYMPTAAGVHAATITVTDDLTRSRLSHPIELTGTCVDPTIYTSPYSQAFDGITVPNLPIDWQKLITAGPTSSIVTSTNAPHSPANCIYMYNSADATPNLLLISPVITNTLPINTMRTKFWAKGSEGYSLSVGIMSDPLDATTYTEVQSITLSATWQEYIVGFQTYTGAGHYIAYKHGLGGTYRGIYIDDALIEVIPQNDLGALTITGNTTPSVGMATNYTINYFNWGTNPQTNYQVKLYKEGNVELASVAGTAIQPGVAGTATLTWTPTTAGPTFIYGKVVLAGDQNSLNDVTPNKTVAVQEFGSMVVTVGEGDQEAQVPVNMYWENSLFETVFQATELNFVGMITGVSFYNNFVTDLLAKPTNVWLGTTTQADLSTGWIPSTDLTQVFTGNVDYPTGQNTITITFPEPFFYLEGNLVMMVQRPLDTQYFSGSDKFYCQTWGTTRSRAVQQDNTEYDPANPPTNATNSGQFPKTGFYVIPGGVGHLTGTVYGAGNLPLPNAVVQIQDWAQTTTDTNGHYLIQNIIDGDYTITASRYGYYDSVQNVTIPEDSTVTLNFTLTQMPTVTVTGTIVGSDSPTVGLPGSTIRLTGYENYEVTANAAGVFTIPGVYVNQTYAYMASGQGYQNRNDEVIVGVTNHNMGNIILNEIAYSPRAVTATESADGDSIAISWLAPDPNAVDVTQGFESIIFPPTDWSQIVTNNGPPNENGGYPTWCRLGAVTVAADLITPPEGTWQAGVWYSFSHQDEWLITPQFNCPQGASLTFETNVFQGSLTGDHYYVKASADNGVTWTELWDASAQTGGWNHYAEPVVLELGQFTGQQIKLAWHADDSNVNNDGMWNVWFIDNVVVANNETTIRFPESQMLTASVKSNPGKTTTVATLPLSRDPENLKRVLQPSVRSQQTHQNQHTDRSLVGFKLWRLPMGQEQNEEVWTPLTTGILTSTNFTDTGWSTMTEGTYKWAVKGIYTNEVLSLAMFSNPVVKGPTLMGSLAGLVRNANNQVIPGAVITMGSYTTTTASNGSYTLAVPEGTHTVTCTATDYNANTQTNVIVSAGLTTVLNFNMGTVSNEDEIAVTATTLKGNHPNPFNPVTTLSFDVKDRAPVRIDIYNVKGQLIRTLVNETKAKGHYSVVWNGKDQHGNEVGSGVYHYRMQAGNYKATRRMMLMK